MTLKTTLIVAVLACAACSGSNLGGTGGSGASAGTGGSAGTSAAGGTSAGGTTGVGGSGGTDAERESAEAHVPRCLADLIAPCTCKVAADGCGARTCFAAGVTTTTTQLDGGTCGGPDDYQEKHVLKPDGSLCYTIRTFWQPFTGGCESVSLGWLDPSGNMVASAYGSPSFQPCVLETPQVTCTATGEIGTVPFSSWPRTDCPANGCQ